MSGFEFIALFGIISTSLAVFTIGFSGVWQDVRSWRVQRQAQATQNTVFSPYASASYKQNKGFSGLHTS